MIRFLSAKKARLMNSRLKLSNIFMWTRWQLSFVLAYLKNTPSMVNYSLIMTIPLILVYHWSCFYFCIYIDDIDINFTAFFKNFFLIFFNFFLLVCPDEKFKW